MVQKCNILVLPFTAFANSCTGVKMRSCHPLINKLSMMEKLKK